MLCKFRTVQHKFRRRNRTNNLSRWEAFVFRVIVETKQSMFGPISVRLQSPRLKLNLFTASLSSMASAKYWLLKAEPDSRLVKGKDVKVGLSCLYMIPLIQV